MYSGANLLVGAQKVRGFLPRTLCYQSSTVSALIPTASQNRPTAVSERQTLTGSRRERTGSHFTPRRGSRRQPSRRTAPDTPAPRRSPPVPTGCPAQWLWASGHPARLSNQSPAFWYSAVPRAGSRCRSSDHRPRVPVGGINHNVQLHTGIRRQRPKRMMGFCDSSLDPPREHLLIGPESDHS